MKLKGSNRTEPAKTETSEEIEHIYCWMLEKQPAMDGRRRGGKMTTKKNIYCWKNNRQWTAEIVLHPAQTGRTRKEAVAKVVAVCDLNPAEIKVVTQTAPQ